MRKDTSNRRFERHVTALVTFAYAALTVAMTWPLARGIARDLPADLGDPLLNVWILDWMLSGIVGIFTGAMTLHDLWNANIFHPEPLTLGFSEHFFGQALTLLPGRALTNNLIFLYNVLFLSTFFLSALGMYLLVRDLTGRRDAAFVAGLMFAFAPLRASQLSHVQVLSTQWMPFSLYAWRRFTAEPTGGVGTAPHPGLFGLGARTGWLIASTLTTLMVIWSSGYYLLYFTPFLALFVFHQMWLHDACRDSRRLVEGGVAALIIALGSWPFVSLYAQVRAVHRFERPAAEVAQFSADAAGYITAPAALRLWGSVLRMRPRPEGELFLGAVAMALAGCGVAAGWKEAGRAAFATHPARSQPSVWSGADACSSTASRARHVAAGSFALLLVAHGAALGALLATGGVRSSVFGVPFRITSGTRLLLSSGVAAVGLLLLSPRIRRTCAAFARSSTAFALVAFILAVWLSLGPLPTSGGRTLEGLGLYGLLFEHVPGFSGLRVPARLALVAMCFLTMLAGAGLAWLLRSTRRPAAVTAAAAALCLLEGCAVPIPVNATWGDGMTQPPPRVYPAAHAPAIYKALAALPEGTVVAEFPFGDPAWELRYVYYATVHRHRLLNGYSGGFPRGYQVRVARLRLLAQAPEDAWQTLRDAGTTHVVLHRREMGADGALTSAWLVDRGARLEARFEGDDELYRLR